MHAILQTPSHSSRPQVMRLRAALLASLVAVMLVVTTVASAQIAAQPQKPAAATPAKDSEPTNPRAVQPERPTVATHAGTVATGYVEVETGFERDRFSDNSESWQIPTVLKIGIASRLQLSIALPVARCDLCATGVGDLSVGIKWRILQDHPILSDFAIQPIVKFATGDQYGTGTTDASLLLIDSHMFGPVALDLNAGVTRRSGDGTSAPKTSTVWTVSSGFPVAGKLSFALEVYGYPGTSGPAGSAPITAILLGPTFLVRPELNLDAGIIEPIAGPQPRAFYAGLVANLGKLPFIKR